MMRNLQYFFLGLLLAMAVLFVPHATAQTVDGAFQRMMNGMVSNTKGVTTISLPSGVSTTGTGTSTVTTLGGLRIPVPETATATMSHSKLSGLATRMARMGSLAGLGFLAWEAYKEYEASGLETCPPPDFFCKRDASGLSTGFEYAYGIFPGLAPWGSSLQEACANAGTHYGSSSLSGTTCTIYRPNGQYWGAVGFSQRASSCQAGWYKKPDGSCVKDVPKVAYTDAQLDQAFSDMLQAKPEFAKRYYDAIRADNVRHGVLDDTYILPPDTPLTIYAPPVTVPERETKRRSFTLPNGDPATEITKETTKVTPTTSGSTVADSKTTYPITKTITTTIINNTTNETTTETTIVNETPQPTQRDDDVSFSDADMPELPTLYEQKYPDGFAGVWRDHKPNVEGTQFWQGIRSMFPNFSGGSCPAWSMQFNIMRGAQFGSMPFDVPCWIFQAIGLIILTTAAFTARKIIF